MADLGVRTWGNSPDGETVLLTGTYQLRGRGQPAAAARRCRRCSCCARRSGDCPLVPLLADEIVKDEPGQEAVLDRLLDLLLIAVLRAWFARPGGRRAGLVPRARPTRSSAARCGCCTTTRPTRGRSRSWPQRPGVSRAALARRFHELVGEPPMTFLTGWRLALAADLLREPGATVGSVAASGRLRQPVRAEHRVQAGPGSEAAGRIGGLADSPIPAMTGFRAHLRYRHLLALVDMVPNIRDIPPRSRARRQRVTWLIWSVGRRPRSPPSWRAENSDLFMIRTQAVLMTTIVHPLRPRGALIRSTSTMPALARAGLVGWMVVDEPVIATISVAIADAWASR